MQRYVPVILLAWFAIGAILSPGAAAQVVEWPSGNCIIAVDSIDPLVCSDDPPVNPDPTDPPDDPGDIIPLQPQMYLEWDYFSAIMPADCQALAPVHPFRGQLHVCGIWWGPQIVVVKWLFTDSLDEGPSQAVWTGVYSPRYGYLHVIWYEYLRPGVNSASGGLPD